MASKLAKSLLTAALAALTPAAALAHTGIGGASGFALGFGHPITGLDHILAMVMIGLFAWQLGGRALWLVPTSFVAVMAGGGALGMAGIGIPCVETAIALSVVALGGIVAFRVKAPTAVAVAAAGLLAIFHGHAHGTDLPQDAGGLVYAAGFMAATALLHLAGIAAGFLIGRTGERYGARIAGLAGGLTTTAGIGLLTAAF